MEIDESAYLLMCKFVDQFDVSVVERAQSQYLSGHCVPEPPLIFTDQLVGVSRNKRKGKVAR